MLIKQRPDMVLMWNDERERCNIRKLDEDPTPSNQSHLSVFAKCAGSDRHRSYRKDVVKSSCRS